MGVVDTVISWAKILQEAWKIDEYKEILNLLEKTREQEYKIHDLLDENKQLKQDLEIKWKIEFKNNFYYIEWDWPYCTRCRDVDKKQVRALPSRLWSDKAKCPNCKNEKNYTGKDNDWPSVITQDYSEFL